MTVILTILKLVGWLLLILLLVLAAVLLLILFYPVGYRVRGSIHQKEINGSLCVYWLFHLFSFCMTFTAGKSSMYIRLFGLKKELSLMDTAASGAKPPDGGTVEAAKREESSKEPEITKTETKKPAGEDASSEPGRETLLERLRQKWKRFLHRLLDVRNTAERLKRMTADTRNRAAVSHLKREVLCLLKHLLPGRLFLDMSYSTGSPDTTAQVFGILALFPVGYQNRWHICPDFEAEAAYIEGDTDTRGHIYMVQLVGIFFRLIADKNCRRLLRQFKNIKS